MEQPEDRYGHKRLADVLPQPAQSRRIDISPVHERKPVEIDAEHQDEEQAREEGRQRETDERQCVGDLVEERVGPCRGEYAYRQRDHQRQYLRRPDHEQGGRQPLQDQRVDIDAADEGEAPVALEHRAGASACNAWQTGSSRPNFARNAARTSGGIARVRRELLERVARRQRQHREEHDADPEQARNRDQQAPQKILAQGPGRVRLERSRASRLAIPVLEVPESVVPAAEVHL